MPPECCKVDYDHQFDSEIARRELLEYRNGGIDQWTQRLVDAVLKEGVEGASLLDIGGGVGAVQLELLEAGIARSLDVDASGPYLAVAQAEAEERGFADRASYRHGDFVAMADGVEPADFVTLDRVICCYGDVRSLVSRSAEKARRLYAVVYPVDRWYMRLAAGLGNLACRLFRNQYRIHIHPSRLVDRLVRDAGLLPRERHAGAIWQTVVYAREVGG